jgi:hypothetical protein
MRPSGGGSLRPPDVTHAVVVVARVLFAAAWLAGQAALVLTAGRRADGAFGFRMFSESSTVAVVLSREVDGPGGERTRVHVDDGTWSAHDASGAAHRFVWGDRVKRGELATFDREIHAKYSAAAQVERWHAALDDVAAHIPDDAETRRLLLDVTVKRNGREPYVVHLASPERAVGGGR